MPLPLLYAAGGLIHVFVFHVLRWRRPQAAPDIARQAFDTPEQDAFCENLSFTPWHSLPEHEPVGVMNRVRRALYQEISRYRHAKNAAPRAEPRGFCLDLTGAPCG
mgnify:CR=1 FL=1